MIPATEYRVGQRVHRVSRQDGRVLYESRIVEIAPLVNARTGETWNLYRLADRDGLSSSVRVEAADLSPVEAP